jgi:hypothetical protein
MIWRQLKHPNILPFLGICADLFAPRLAIVSPYMNNGNLRMYQRNHPYVDRVQMVNVIDYSVCRCLNPFTGDRCRAWPLLPA